MLIMLVEIKQYKESILAVRETYVNVDPKK